MSTKKKCPYCGQPIRRRQIAEYILHGTAHTIKCDGCGRMLRPSRYPFSFGVCYAVAVFYTIGAMNLMLYVLHFSFLKALLCFLASFAVILALLCLATIATTEFDGNELIP